MPGHLRVAAEMQVDVAGQDVIAVVAFGHRRASPPGREAVEAGHADGIPDDFRVMKLMPPGLVPAGPNKPSAIRVISR